MADDTSAPRRKAISKRLRYEILRRDNFTCRYCGATAPDVKLQVDHVLAVTLGGSDDPSNLATSCEDCNGGKASTAPDQSVVEGVCASARAMADAVHLASQERREQREVIARQVEAFDAYWDDWRGTKTERAVPRPDDWDLSVERFLTLGLDVDDLARCIRIAMSGPARSAGVWSYFCGVAWNEIRDLQRAAQRMAERQPEDR